MASLELEGFDSLEDAFRRISEIPFEVTAEALDGMAEVAMKKIKSQGESMGVRDPDSDVHILDKIKANKAKQTQSGGYENITFSGSRTRGRGKRTRNAEIAFVNEYGKRGQRARPFIGTAMTQNEDAILAPAEKTIGGWIEKTFTQN